jgi:hypothetical protein
MSARRLEMRGSPAGSGLIQPAPAVRSSPKTYERRQFSIFARRIYSVVFRLIGPREFVDRLQNSVVPLSNEFLPQVIDNDNGYMLPSRPVHCKKCDFVVFAQLATRPGVALSVCMALCVEPTRMVRLNARRPLDIREMAGFADLLVAAARNETGEPSTPILIKGGYTTELWQHPGAGVEYTPRGGGRRVQPNHAAGSFLTGSSRSRCIER